MKYPRLAYQTARGKMYLSSVESYLESDLASSLRGKVQLIFTSPPFPLKREKQYGNLNGQDYLEWLAGFAVSFKKLLKPNGSIVLELGNSWVRKQPVMSTLSLESLLEFKRKANLYLCQQFVCYNPARLPSPVQWVNVERIRVKDSFTHIWWMAKTTKPKANNRKVLQEYSNSMKSLLRKQNYNSGKRPSGHHIGQTSFLAHNDGSIPSNVLAFPNTSSTDGYQEFCRKKSVPIHPARMQKNLARFFIKFLSSPRELILDPFAGSNTTGAIAEELKRRWVSIENNSKYVIGSRGRFKDFTVT